MSDISITVREEDDVTILKLDGKLCLDPKITYDAVDQFRDTIRTLIKKGRSNILVNMENLGYIDSSGIGELVSSFTAAKKEKGNLKLLKLTQKIQDLLAITKLLTVFDIFDEEEKALASYRKK